MAKFRVRRFLHVLILAAGCLTASPPIGAVPPTFPEDPEYLIDTWEAEDGLPENSATAVALGPEGYLWFGTWKGLVRFDGLEFNVLDPGNTPGLPGEAIIHLHADTRGRLWVSTGNGLVVREGATWRRYGTNDGWAGSYVRTFADRPDGDLLFTTFDGHVLQSVGGQIRELPRPPGESDQGYFGAVDAGLNWVLQNRFFGSFRDGRWVSARPLSNDLARAEVSCAPAQGGGFWALLGRDLLGIRNGEEVSDRRLSESIGGVWSMMEDSRSNLWLSTFDSGLVRVRPDGSIRRWNTANGLRTLGLRCVVEDREGNLWVGTSGGGLSRFRPRRATDASSKSPLAGRRSNSIALSATGNLWIASFESGLFQGGTSGLARVPVGKPPHSAPYGLAVLEDRAGRVWFGEKDGGWWRTADARFERIPVPWPSDVYLQSLFEDGNGDIWMGDSRGVVRFDGTKFHVYTTEAGLPRSDRIAFAHDHLQRLWVAADGGLFRFEDERFVEVRTSEGASLPGIRCLLPDPDGGVWMGTAEEGLWRWREGRVGKLGAAQGYPVGSVHGILDDGLGHLWMPSQRGIVRASRVELEAVAEGRLARLDCLVLDRHDGLPSIECSTSQPSCARDASGKLWFATQRGIAVIDPAAVRPNPIPPPVHILRLDYHLPYHDSADQRASPTRRDLKSTVVRHPAPFPDPLRLPPGSFGLQIAYTAPSFRAPERVRYQTRLDGISETWEDAGNQRLARFAQLPPGDYVFRVRAANDDGVWNERGAAMAFTVAPYYWQTQSFRGVIGLLLIVGGAVLVWGRTRARRRLELEEMARLQRRAAERERADRKFLLAVEASPNGIVLTSEEGRIVLVNARIEQFFGYDRSDLVGQRLEFLLPDRAPTPPSDIRTSDRGAAEPRGLAHRRELLGRRKDGSEFPVEIAMSPIEGEDERLVLTAVTDITARKQSEEALARHRNELAHMSRVTMLGEISGSLAHELNQPLTSILSNAQAAQRFLDRPTPDVDEVRAILQDIVDEDQRAGEIIRRLRGLLKKGDECQHPLHPGVIVQEVLRLVRSDLLNQGVTSTVQLSPNTPRVCGDRVQLQQVILNLLMNACEAMSALPRPERRLLVRTERDAEGSFHLVVSDRGPGIPPGDLERVFTPFFTTKSNGMGLGLSVCRTIVAAHRGRLWAANRPDGGASFHLTLPAVDRSPLTGQAEVR